MQKDVPGTSDSTSSEKEHIVSENANQTVVQRFQTKEQAVKEKNQMKDQMKESVIEESKERYTHTCHPIYDAQCTILILGTFPSVKSREARFYYGHPQNRFWKVLSAVFEEELPTTPEEKTNFLLRNHIALWDVIESCEVTGSSDSSIRNVIPNDITRILDSCPIRAIYGNGGTALTLYNRFLRKKTGVDMIRLPSTSPANATCTLSKLIESWNVIREDESR